MIEFIKWIFSDFFIWLGVVIIIGMIFTGIVEIIQALRK